MSIRAIRGRKDIPAERTEHTEPSGREEPPTDEHRCSQIRRVWHPCHTHAAKFCVFCEFCGRTAHPNHLCSSVPSVGEKIFPQNAHTEPSGREEPPTDVHRLGWQGIPAIPTLPNSVNSVNSVGEQRTPTICVNLCHPWEKRYSHRTHGTHRTFWQRRASRRCSQIRRVWHPCHTHAAQFCVFCVFCGRTAHHNHLCSSVPSVGEKIFPQNAHTEPSGREEPLTNEHGCSQIRRVWHPCHTHAAKFRGRTAHHNHLCRSVPSVGVLSLQEGSVRSVHSVGGVAVVWCSRDCCTP